MALAWLSLNNLTSRSASAEGEPLYNLVVFIADDLGWNDVGYHGSEIETPNIDALVAGGVELDRHYAYPVCSPTRAAFLTGRYAYNNGISGVVTGSSLGLSLKEHLMPETFSAAGFQTWALGKWHLGGKLCDSYTPYNRGFDHFYGFLGGAINAYTHKPGTLPGADIDWQRNGVTIDEEGYCTDLLADEAVWLLDNRDTESPFFMYFCFHAVHTPLLAPQDLIDKYEALGLTGNRAKFAAKAESMDTAIGTVVQKLSDLSLTNDTLILFISDNGGNSTTSGGADNTPLRGRKGTVYEGGIRVPGVISWAGVLPAGVKSTQVITVADYFPTLASALGVAPANTLPLDGRDLWGQINQTQPELPADNVVISNMAGNVALIDGQWKLVYVASSGTYELYDLDSDPYEATDVTDQPTIKSNMTTQMAPYLAVPTIPKVNDLDGNGVSDEGDLEIMADQWLQTTGDRSADIASPCDDIVNFLDFSELAKLWLQ
jgi:arylsulfatase A-like enzyme